MRPASLGQWVEHQANGYGFAAGACRGTFERKPPLAAEDINCETGFVHVRKQLDRSRNYVELKTDAGSRDVVLAPQLAKLLKEHRLASRYKALTDPVFPCPDGRGRDRRSTACGVERALERAGLSDAGISPHSVRHTFASMLIVQLKLDPARVAAQLPAELTARESRRSRLGV